LLQRRLKVGYARAARILDILEEQGFIGPADGAKPREILVSKSEMLGETSDADEEDEVDGEDFDDGSIDEDFEEDEDEKKDIPWE